MKASKSVGPSAARPDRTIALPEENLPRTITRPSTIITSIDEHQKLNRRRGRSALESVCVGTLVQATEFEP